MHVPITGSCCTTGDNEIVPITKAVDSVEADLSEDEAEDIEKVHQDYILRQTFVHVPTHPSSMCGALSAHAATV